MKSLKIIVLLLLTAGFVHAQDVVVKGNTKVNVDFSKFKTFSWSQADETVQPASGYYIYTYTEERALPQRTDKKTVTTTTTTAAPAPYIYSYNVIIPSSNAMVNTTIKNAVTEELTARGYRENVIRPDLLVTYRVLERQARMKGYINDVPTMVGTKEVREAKDTTTHVLLPGTLVISLIDTKTSEVIWDGFASGLVRENAFITEETKIKEAVHLILEEFKHRGDKVNKVN